MRRPKYSVSQQIKSLKSHGVTFNLYTEADAQELNRTPIVGLK
ncbi:hypothetical protein APC1461_0194 [Bifidobacterium longum]|uniref:Uncharacterized protein n=1 Tax=Bifidobacterium longum TaxID=216816 RepID=A0A2N0TLA9_BIFLN|nr:hypothetical protein APC1461_0194 [Bifidobacterium longum]